jgi:integrase
MTLAQARKAAAEARLTVERGEDVRQTKQAAQQPFSVFLDTFYARWKAGKRDGSIEATEPKVKLLKERLGDVPASLITTGKIADALSGLPASTAHRCLYITQQALRIAVVQNAVKTNVARELKSTDINSAPKERVPRTAVSVEDLPAVIAKVAERSQVSADVLGIVALCATRIQETVLMEWQHIDWTNKLWNIPAETRKGKLDVRNGLVVPLSDTAFAVLHEIAERKLSDRWVFVGNMGRAVDRRTVLANLKLAAPATVHGFRKLFSTQANEQGFDANVIEAALGHVIKGVAGVYNKATYLEQRRELMEWWAGWLDQHAAKALALAQAAD